MRNLLPRNRNVQTSECEEGGAFRQAKQLAGVVHTVHYVGWLWEVTVSLGKKERKIDEFWMVFVG